MARVRWRFIFLFAFLVRWSVEESTAWCQYPSKKCFDTFTGSHNSGDFVINTTASIEIQYRFYLNPFTSHHEISPCMFGTLTETLYRTVPLPYCPFTVLSLYRTVPLPYCPITVLSHYRTVSLPYPSISHKSSEKNSV